MANWKRANEQYFEFLVPPDMEKVPVKGEDSFVGQYRSGSIELLFDYGMYASSLGHDGLPKRSRFSEATVEINGHKAKIVSYKESESQFFMAVHFAKGGRSYKGGSKLTMSCFCKSEKDYDAVRKIFNSIKFLE